MRKTSILLSMLVLGAMVLAACGGGATSTNVAPTSLPVTAIATEPMTATEMPTEAATATEAGVPVTGNINPARLSNELTFPVLDQSGSQVGQVSDMVLDLTNTTVAYVVVDANGNTVAVPWDMLTVQAAAGTGTPSAGATAAPEMTATSEGAATSAPTEAPTGAATEAATQAATQAAGQGLGIASDQNAFIFQGDASLLTNAPAFDSTSLPQMGQASTNWDAAIQSYWQSGGAAGGASTPSAGATSEATAMATEAATEAATQAATTGPQALQGVMLASDLLGSTLTLGMSTGTGTGQATMEPGATSAPEATASPAAGATSEATASPVAGAGTSNMSVTIEDAIVDTASGNIKYLVVSGTFDNTQHLIPVPLSMFQWDASTNNFILNVDATMLQNAPSFLSDQFPDTTTSGWDSQFNTFWQSGGASSGGANATATP